MLAHSIGGSSRGGYRSLNRNAYLDETLFGDTIHHRMHPHADAGKEIQIAGKDTVQVRKEYNRPSCYGGPRQGAVVITASEPNRLRTNATLLTKKREMGPKERLIQLCQKVCKRPVGKKDIVYAIQSFQSESHSCVQYQAIVQLKCFEKAPGTYFRC